MRLEEASQTMFITSIALLAVLWFAVEHWDEVLAPAIQTIGALAWVMRMPVLAALAIVLAFLVFRLSGPRG